MAPHNEIAHRLSSARIPVSARTLTLERAKQTLLRSVVLDGAYQSQGILKSIAITRPAGMDRVKFYKVFVRFVAELSLVGQDVVYAGTHTIRRELTRWANGDLPTDAAIERPGFIAVPDLFEKPDDMPSEVIDYLVDFSARGAGIILAIDLDAAESADADATGLPVFPPALEALIQSSLPLTPTIY